ncbi:hypothetical protein F2P81_018099 [Scophthalmus maximus]|uniref:Uncharacterized protein n=1 Tax=Scophthalmus maximus TaxID=52904 RepID=A0A6A4SDL8_SCOMX|nr:hypothetical protein F2P81_018099 [Scophthalmus maximus]
MSPAWGELYLSLFEGVATDLRMQPLKDAASELTTFPRRPFSSDATLERCNRPNAAAPPRSRTRERSKLKIFENASMHFTASCYTWFECKE